MPSAQEILVVQVLSELAPGSSCGIFNFCFLHFFFFLELPRPHSLNFTHLIGYIIQQPQAWPLTIHEDATDGKSTQVAQNGYIL